MDINSVINYLNTSNKETEKTLINGFINEITIKYLPLYVSISRLALSVSFCVIQ